MRTLPWLLLSLQLFFLSYHSVEGWRRAGKILCTLYPKICKTTTTAGITKATSATSATNINTTTTTPIPDVPIPDVKPEGVLKYLQPDNIGRDPLLDDLNHNDPIICSRNCTTYPDPRICYYVFNVEVYQALGPACQNCSDGNTEHCLAQHCISANGIERQVMSINRMIPGPAIDVCRGDRIIVDVVNKMPAETVTMHWHGVLQQGTPWMDGVPYITQCPITPNNKFRYDFKALTNGSLFYHSHIGMSHADGVVGSLTVRLPQHEDPNSVFQDFDLPSHNVLILDWYTLPCSVFVPGYYKNESHTAAKPYTYLINGYGRHKDSVTQTKVPLAEFHVERGYRYRFRIIGGTTSTCAFKFAVQNHSMSVVALDGFPCAPFPVDTLVMSGGQRTDVIIETNQTKSTTYWMMVEGMNQCSGISQVAYLIYDKSTSRPEDPPAFETLNERSIYLNNFELDCFDPNNTCSDTIRQPAYSQAPPAIKRLMDQQPNVTVTFVAGNKKLTVEEIAIEYQHYHLPGGERLGPFVNMLNNVSGILPPVPLLTQRKDIPADFPICTDCENTEKEFRACLCIIDIPLNAIVDVVFTDNGTRGGNKNRALHPFHIHGHHFTVIPVQYSNVPVPQSGGPSSVLRSSMAVEEGLIQRDTVFIPLDGLTKVRFLADNAGYWLMHCHYSMHMEGGMFVVFKVGSDEEIPKPPSADFPKCGHYLPSL